MASTRRLAREEIVDLTHIINIGPSIAGDLRRIGIEVPADLCGQDPYEMYTRLCQADGRRHDPCVLDVFISAVAFMQGGPARPWWKYTAQRNRELAKRAQATHPAQQPHAAAKSGRRAFMKDGALVLLAARALRADAMLLAAPETDEVAVRFGVMTDLHYADKPAGGTRHYRQTPAKLAAAARRLPEFAPEFIVELGDFIDAADSVETEQEYLKTIHRQFAALPGKKHYVLGNHCVYSLVKREFLDVVGQSESYYSFDVEPFHFIVLDACFRSDGEPYGRKNFQWTDPNIVPDELQWLQADLEKSRRQTIVFLHQRLDVSDHYGVKNAPQVRETLEISGKVLAVFQGHNHLNDHREIAGIHYCTLSAMVEGATADDNAFAAVEVLSDGTIRVKGFYKQSSYQMA